MVAENELLPGFQGENSGLAKTFDPYWSQESIRREVPDFQEFAARKEIANALETRFRETVAKISSVPVFWT